MAAYRVLVVDDNHEVRRMVTASIKTLGAEIDVLDVPSAEEALFIIASLSFDLVVLDFRLPGMSGLEMVDRLRKHKPEIKIILVTGVEDTATRQQVAQAGVAAFFYKPIDIATFLAAVRICLWSDQDVVDLPTANISSNDVPSASAEPGVKRGLTKILKPSTSGEPSVSGEPSASGEPNASGEPSVSGEPSASGAKSVSGQAFQLTLDKRLTALKQQVRALSVLLINETGQVVEVAGNPSSITSGSVLLPALMEAFRTSHKVSDALGKDSIESLLYFADAKQRIYLAPVNLSNALLMVTIGYFEPDKLGILDRAIHLAVHDLRDILERMQEEENLKSILVKAEQTELPAEIIVDPETLAGVADMFSQAPKGGVKDQAEGFWESLGEKVELDGTQGKDVLSYDQARDMGLAPDDNNQS
jgi:DNA-binding response OmpR family regulator